MFLADLFLNPWPKHMPAGAALWMVLPLCVAVAIVYKAIRVHHVRTLAREAVVLMLYMVGGLSALGAGLWALAQYWPK